MHMLSSKTEERQCDQIVQTFLPNSSTKAYDVIRKRCAHTVRISPIIRGNRALRDVLVAIPVYLGDAIFFWLGDQLAVHIQPGVFPHGV